MNFKIEAAVAKPQTSHPGISIYPWADVGVGEGFHVPDPIDENGQPVKRKPNNLKTSATQWAKRKGLGWTWEAFRYEHPENGWGIQIQRIS